MATPSFLAVLHEEEGGSGGSHVVEGGVANGQNGLLFVESGIAHNHRHQDLYNQQKNEDEFSNMRRKFF